MKLIKIIILRLLQLGCLLLPWIVTLFLVEGEHAQTAFIGFSIFSNILIIGLIIRDHKRFSEPKPQRTFDLDDWHPLKERYEVFHDIIDRGLELRDSKPDWAYEPIEDESINYFFNQKYVEWICKEIHKEFKADVDLQRIVNLDVYCSGHVDYMYKFSFRLAELEEALLNED